MTAMRTYRNASVPLAVSPPAAGGDITRWFYDTPTGLLTNKLYADNLGTSHTYTYTPDHKLASRIWDRGIAATYAYAYAPPRMCLAVMRRCACGRGRPRSRLCAPLLSRIGLFRKSSKSFSSVV
jgi:hypothetical protein